MNVIHIRNSGGTPAAYISNGTMGETWQAQNCERCAKDHGWHADEEAAEQCPVLTALLIGEHPIEGLVRHADRPWPSELECTYFQPCACGRQP